jgi:hypothetical protein
MKALLGKRVFQADVLTPKGLDDRTEGKLALQRPTRLPQRRGTLTSAAS